MELPGTQTSGTPITLGTQFTNFSTLDFAAQARWTVDATRGDLTGHALSVAGFAIGDKLDITNLAAAGAKLSFNTTTDELTVTKATTTINLQFDSAFAGRHFVLSADGNGGANLHLLSGAGATLEASALDVKNFVSAEHSALVSNQSRQCLPPPRWTQVSRFTRSAGLRC